MDDQHSARDISVSRRDFAALSVGVGVAVTAAAESATAAPAQVMEMDVTVKTPDGACDAAFFHPQKTGAYPAVVIWPDALGLRPFFRDMGRRLAAEGYAVLVPNPFYRTAKAPVFPNGLDFANPADRGKLTEHRAPMTPEAVSRDAVAFVAFLDGQSVVSKKAKVGVHGYCMGGPLMVQTAAAVPGRIGAGASLHGGGLVTDKPDSPHLLIPKLKGSYYFGIADNDDKQQPTAKDTLKESFAAAKTPAKIEVYDGCQHGWCAADMPVYNKAGADKAWAEVVALYKRALV